MLLGRARRSKAESQRLDQLSEAVRNYERQHFPVPARSPAERLLHLLELHDTNTRQLAAATGVTASVIDGVIAGTATFTETDAQLLADHFSLESDAFLA